MNLDKRHHTLTPELARIAMRVAADKAYLLHCALECEWRRRYLLAMGQRETAAWFVKQKHDFKARYRAALHAYNDVVHNGRVNLALISRYMHD